MLWMAESYGHFDTVMSNSANSTSSQRDEQAIQNVEAYVLEVSAKKALLVVEPGEGTLLAAH